MNRNNKKIGGAIVVLGIAFFSLGIFFLSNKPNSNTTKNIILQAKTDSFENMEELEDATPIIVKGIKTYENEPSIRKNEYGETIAVYTLSSFKINEVFKNNTDLIITSDSEIPILENEAYDEETNTIYHIAGYKKMNTNNEYILFLYYSASDDWYVPTGVTFGKIPTNNTEENLYLEAEEMSRSNEKPIQDIIADQIREKYNN